MNRFLLLIVALILYGSLNPWRFDFGRPGSPLDALLRNWPAYFDRYAFRDAVVNSALYFPLGAIGWMAAARRHVRGSAAARALAMALALSACVELLQYYDRSRVCSLFDLTTNVLGAAAGAAAAMTLRARLAQWRPARLPPRDAAAGGLLLASWVVYQLCPLYPMPAQLTLRGWLERFAQPGSVSATEVWAAAAEWFAAAMLLEAITGRPRLRWLLAAMLCLPLRIFMPEHTLAPAEPLGAALAVLLCVAGRKAAFRARAGAWMLLSAIALGEIDPIHFSRAANAISWIPFRASFGDGWQGSAFVLWRKVCDYGVAACLLRSVGQSYLTTGAVLAAGLALCGTAQIWLPGRTPGTTDSALALAIGFVLSWLAGRGTEKPPVP